MLFRFSLIPLIGYLAVCGTSFIWANKEKFCFKLYQYKAIPPVVVDDEEEEDNNDHLEENLQAKEAYQAIKIDSKQRSSEPIREEKFSFQPHPMQQSLQQPIHQQYNQQPIMQQPLFQQKQEPPPEPVYQSSFSSYYKKR